MAEIDKALPNEVRKEVNVPSQEDIQVELEQQPEEKGPVEVVKCLKIIQITNLQEKIGKELIHKV
jgi:hypothetical protein